MCMLPLPHLLDTTHHLLDTPLLLLPDITLLLLLDLRLLLEDTLLDITPLPQQDITLLPLSSNLRIVTDENPITSSVLLPMHTY